MKSNESQKMKNFPDFPSKKIVPWGLISFHFTSFRPDIYHIFWPVLRLKSVEIWILIKCKKHTYTLPKIKMDLGIRQVVNPFFDLLVKVRLRRQIQKNRRHKMDINRWCEEIYVSNKYEGIFRATKESSFCDIWFRFEKFSFLFFSPVIPLLVPICRSCWMICNFENLKSSTAKVTKYLFWVNCKYWTIRMVRTE